MGQFRPGAMNSTSQFISVRETAQILGVSEKKVMDLIEQRRLQAYRIANQFLRLKKTDVIALKKEGQIPSEVVIQPYTPAERLRDFWYFNDFYILCAAIILALLYVIFFV